jgi:hypothetical protein
VIGRIDLQQPLPEVTAEDESSGYATAPDESGLAGLIRRSGVARRFIAGWSYQRGCRSEVTKTETRN